MASLNMGVSYALTQDNINAYIEEKKIGNYAYGYLSDRGVFIVKYVGRSDTDLRTRIAHGIKEREKNPSKYKYERFKFSYASTPLEAYKKECKNYHDFGGDRGRLINDQHPDTPDGVSVSCPVCGS